MVGEPRVTWPEPLTMCYCWCCQCTEVHPCDALTECQNLSPGFLCTDCPPGWTSPRVKGTGITYAKRNRQVGTGLCDKKLLKHNISIGYGQLNRIGYTMTGTPFLGSLEYNIYPKGKYEINSMGKVISTLLQFCAKFKVIKVLCFYKCKTIIIVIHTLEYAYMLNTYKCNP